MPPTTACRVAQGLAKIAMAMRHSAWRDAAPHGLTPTQAQVLITLARRQPGDPPPTLGSIAQSLAITAATASDAVSTLKSKRLLSKTRHGRRVELSLTEAGFRRARELMDWPDFLAEPLEELDHTERASFLRCIVKLIHGLQERGRIPVQRMCVECQYFAPWVHDDPSRPHHCRFVDAPIGDADLLLDCPDQRPLQGAARSRIYELFVHGKPAALKRGRLLRLSEEPHHE